MSDTPGFSWCRLEADWWWAGWTGELDPGPKDCYPYFIAHVKANHNGRGVCRAMSAGQFAQMFKRRVEDVEVFLAAAVKAEALIIDKGLWKLADPAPVQSPDAERKRQEREEERLAARKNGKAGGSAPPGSSGSAAASAPAQRPGHSENVRDKQEGSQTKAEIPGQARTLPESPPFFGTSGDCPDSCHATLTSTAPETTTTGARAPEAERERPASAWPRHEDPLAQLVADSVLQVPKYSQRGALCAPRLEELLASARSFAPDDAALRVEIGSWAAANRAQLAERGGEDAIAALSAWLDRRRPAWERRAKGARARPAPRLGEDFVWVDVLTEGATLGFRGRISADGHVALGRMTAVGIADFERYRFDEDLWRAVARGDVVEKVVAVREEPERPPMSPEELAAHLIRVRRKLGILPAEAT